ncbi:MAG: aminotransferase class I/II-fold pyridoxal phosphate-dependent enzyme [Roseburia sp.]|nr:aminotransferase class I/II-fold pyridoxal phosphate-dependent enzyme [Roseburia sp.]
MNYDDFINRTVSDIPPSGIRKFFDLVANMDGALSLGVGEPDFVTPWLYRDSAVKSIISGRTGYTANRGDARLVREITLYNRDRFGLNYDEDETIVTVGASEGIDLALRTLVSRGDGVLVPDPSYVSYMPNVAIVGGTVKPIRLDKSDGFKLTPEKLESAIDKTCKILLLPYPNNPTGAILEKAELQALVPVIKKHNLFVISDEIYAELTYGRRHVSIASLDGMKERTVVLNGFSKAFAMTGWRIGYFCAPKAVAAAALKIHQYTIMCAPTASQQAALAALEDGRETEYEQVEYMRAEYDRRRSFTVAMLNDMGLDCFTPYGAFYAFPDVSRYAASGDEFAEKLLRAQKVAVVPGSAFGGGGKNNVRCTYASSIKTLNKAFDRMREYIKTL